MSERVRIEAIAAGGSGVGRLADGRAVFLPRTAVGDLVEPTGIRRFARYARARVGAELAPGPDRVEPRCRHYLKDHCGGCQLQHLAPEAQRRARGRIVGDALRRLGRLSVPDPPVEPSEREWGYRTRITLAFDAAGRVGFHPLDRPNEVFPLERCEIAHEALNELWSALRAEPAVRPAGLKRITLRLAPDQSRHLVLHGPARPAWAGVDALARRAASAGGPVTLWWRPRPQVTERLQGPPGDGLAGSFEQAHPAMARRVRQQALAYAGDLRARRVWDLYAGRGELTTALADRGALVDSVELDAGAAAFAERSAPRPEISRRVGRVEDWVGRLAPPEVVLVNPPRTGLGPEVTQALAARGPARVVYISCDPATLARDLRRLGSAFHLTSLSAFDLFPQTAHVETVARLEHR